MFDFKPSESSAPKIPFFEDARRGEGWQGYATTRSIKSLETGVASAIQRLGGTLSGFQTGTYHLGEIVREGYQIQYWASNGKAAMSIRPG